MVLSPAQWIEMEWDHYGNTLSGHSALSRSVSRSVNLLRASTAQMLSWVVVEAFGSAGYGKVLLTTFDGWMAAPHRWKQETSYLTWLFSSLTFFRQCFFTFAVSMRNRLSPCISPVATIKKLRGDKLQWYGWSWSLGCSYCSHSEYSGFMVVKEGTKDRHVIIIML